jgi:NHL repeat
MALASGSMTLGTGDYRYEVIQDWGHLPDGWSLQDVAAVAVDHKDQVYVFNRGAHPMIVFDREGNFLRSWGEGVFTRAHGIHIGSDESLYCTDDGDHTVRKCTLDGKVLLTIGIPGEPAPYMSGEPFHRCTHTALSPRGDIYVSDGYGNARIHQYTPDGKLRKSWGQAGTGPGEFNLPHNLCCDPDGWIYVADRENHRVQVFDGEGRYETEWHNLHRPCGMVMEAKRQPLCYIGEIGPTLPINRDTPNLGPRISIVDHEGKLLSRFGAAHAGIERPDEFIAPHGMAVDSRGDIYVGEVSYTTWPYVYPDRDVPAHLRTLRKLVRVT